MAWTLLLCASQTSYDYLSAYYSCSWWEHLLALTYVKSWIRWLVPQNDMSSRLHSHISIENMRAEWLLSHSSAALSPLKIPDGSLWKLNNTIQHAEVVFSSCRKSDRSFSWQSSLTQKLHSKLKMQMWDKRKSQNTWVWNSAEPALNLLCQRLDGALMEKKNKLQIKCESLNDYLLRCNKEKREH